MGISALNFPKIHNMCCCRVFNNTRPSDTRQGVRTVFYCVDRINGGTAVLVPDGGNAFDARLDSLPGGIREGSILILTPEGYVRDEAEEEYRRQKAKKLLDRLFE